MLDIVLLIGGFQANQNLTETYVRLISGCSLEDEPKLVCQRFNISSFIKQNAAGLISQNEHVSAILRCRSRSFPIHTSPIK